MQAESEYVHQANGEDRPHHCNADEGIHRHKASASQAAKQSRMDHGPGLRDVHRSHKEHNLAAQGQIAAIQMIEPEQRNTKQQVKQPRRKKSASV